MSVKALRKEDWYFDDIDCQTELSVVIEAASSKLVYRDHFVILRSRRMQGVFEFTPENMAKATYLEGRTGPKGLPGWSMREKVFVCTDDKLGDIDGASGDCVQSQTWEHWSEQQDLPETEMKASV
jgi:hypothetical protein